MKKKKCFSPPPSSSIASAKLHVTFVGLLYEATKVNESEEFVNLNQNTDLVLPCKLSNRIVSFCIAACTALRNLTTKFDIQVGILEDYRKHYLNIHHQKKIIVDFFFII